MTLTRGLALSQTGQEPPRHRPVWPRRPLARPWRPLWSAKALAKFGEVASPTATKTVGEAIATMGEEAAKAAKALARSGEATSLATT
ncbi:hypothetical protein NL676_003505 [Syzygium grande]|nr:hypothetical protein NL676_003505 [Syzygium grande]